MKKRLFRQDEKEIMNKCVNPEKMLEILIEGENNRQEKIKEEQWKKSLEYKIDYEKVKEDIKDKCKQPKIGIKFEKII